MPGRREIAIFKSDPATSIRMMRIKSTDTGLEKIMENILVDTGITYNSHPKLYGHPDFSIPTHKMAIFCDSSFWHGRNPDDVSGRNFKRNRELWVKKLTKTIERDKKINAELAEMGWKVLRFWDNEILKSPEECKNKILREIYYHK